MLGPLPDFICFSNVCLKNFIHCALMLTVLASTFTRFMFVCIFKSIPLMNDNFFANILSRCICLISIILVALRVKSPGKYPLNYVSRILHLIFKFPHPMYLPRNQKLTLKPISWFVPCLPKCSSEMKHFTGKFQQVLTLKLWEF